MMFNAETAADNAEVHDVLITIEEGFAIVELSKGVDKTNAGKCNDMIYFL